MLERILPFPIIFEIACHWLEYKDIVYLEVALTTEVIGEFLRVINRPKWASCEEAKWLFTKFNLKVSRRAHFVGNASLVSDVERLEIESPAMRFEELTILSSPRIHLLPSLKSILVRCSTAKAISFVDIFTTAGRECSFHCICSSSEFEYDSISQSVRTLGWPYCSVSQIFSSIIALRSLEIQFWEKSYSGKDCFALFGNTLETFRCLHAIITSSCIRLAPRLTSLSIAFMNADEEEEDYAFVERMELIVCEMFKYERSTQLLRVTSRSTRCYGMLHAVLRSAQCPISELEVTLALAADTFELLNLRVSALSTLRAWYLSDGMEPQIHWVVSSVAALRECHIQRVKAAQVADILDLLKSSPSCSTITALAFDSVCGEFDRDLTMLLCLSQFKSLTSLAITSDKPFSNRGMLSLIDALRGLPHLRTVQLERLIKSPLLRVDRSSALPIVPHVPFHWWDALETSQHVPLLAANPYAVAVFDVLEQHKGLHSFTSLGKCDVECLTQRSLSLATFKCCQLIVLSACEDALGCWKHVSRLSSMLWEVDFPEHRFKLSLDNVRNFAEDIQPLCPTHTDLCHYFRAVYRLVQLQRKMYKLEVTPAHDAEAALTTTRLSCMDILHAAFECLPSVDEVAIGPGIDVPLLHSLSDCLPSNLRRLSLKLIANLDFRTKQHVLRLVKDIIAMRESLLLVKLDSCGKIAVDDLLVCKRPRLKLIVS